MERFYARVKECLIFGLSQKNAKNYVTNRLGIKIKAKQFHRMYTEAVNLIESKNYNEQRMIDHIQHDLIYEHFDRYDNLKAVIDILNRSLIVATQGDSSDLYLAQKLAATVNDITKTMVAMNLSSPVFAKYKYLLENNLIEIRNNQVIIKDPELSVIDNEIISEEQQVKKDPVDMLNAFHDKLLAAKSGSTQESNNVDQQPTDSDRPLVSNAENEHVPEYARSTVNVLRGSSENELEKFEPYISRDDGEPPDPTDETESFTELQQYGNDIGKVEGTLSGSESIPSGQAQEVTATNESGTTEATGRGTEKSESKITARKRDGTLLNKRGNKSSQRVF